MSTVALTKDDFAKTVEDNGIVLVDFWAEWCGPCRQFGPVYEKVSEKHPEIVFGKVDTEAQQELAAAFGVSSIPTVVALREGVVLYARPGALPEPALEDLVAKVSEVDMEEVRTQIADQEAAQDEDGAAARA